MSDYKKLAFVGGVGSGKTTIIRTLSETATINTDKRSTVDIGKQFTTVGIDYGRITLGDSMALGLYGVPGQRRFSMLWDHINHSLWGIVFLVRYTESPDVEDLSEIINFFDPVGHQTPFLIGLTHSDLAEDEDVEAVAEILQQHLINHHLPAAVVAVDCTSFDSSMHIPLIVNALHQSRQSAS